MTQLNRMDQDRRPESELSSLVTVDAEVKELEAARLLARQQLHSFSFDTLRRWHELEREVECKLDDMGRLSETGETGSEAARARLRELIAAVRKLVHKHSLFPAQTLMQPNVRTCSPRDSLEHAARLLWEGDCGALPVVDDAGKTTAMITDRDICMAVYTQDRAPRECRVESAMSKPVYFCSPEDSIQRIAEIMSEHQVRRVPVVSPDGRLLGIVTLADLAKFLTGLSTDDPARELLLPVLAGISYPRLSVPCASEERHATSE